jgi:hypothetical protein
MKNQRVRWWALGALLVAAPFPAFGHHGNAAYDEKKEIMLRGTVTEVVWANPHAQIYFDVKNPNGSVVHWGCETLSPGKLLRSGWTKDAVKAGDQVTVTLVAARNGAPVGLLHKLVFDDGRTLGTNEAPQQ